jgi:hypothetical protein
MSTQHLEVVPRIIDPSIAASYQLPSKTSTNAESTKVIATKMRRDSHMAAVVVPLTVTQKFFTTIKDYLVPILFIIATIVIIYVLWKYWTKYRTKVDTEAAMVMQHAANTLPADSQEAMGNPVPTDLSKYILTTDGSSESDGDSIHGKLSTISEDMEPSSSLEDDANSLPSLEYDSNNDSNDDESDGESDVESLISEPDFSVISNLINQPIDEYVNDRFEYLNDDNISATNSIHTEMDPDESHMEDDTLDPKPVAKAPKRGKKTKRVVL